MSTSRKVAAAVATAGLLAAAWLAHRAMDRDGDESAEQAPASVAKVAPRASPAQSHGEENLIRALVPKVPPPASVAQPPQRFVLRSPPGRLDLVVAEVTPAAEAGDVAAMRTLGEVLRQCAHADMRNDSAIETDAARQSLDVEYMQKKGVVAAAEGETDPRRMAVRMAQTQERVRDSCRKIPPGELKRADEWIAKAAATGDEGAGLDRVGSLERQIRDNSLPAEEREQLRAQMNEMLQDEIAQGHCNNMVLNMFWQDSRDPLLTYIYGGILTRRGIGTIDSMPPDERQSALDSAQRELRKLAAAVPPDQLAAAEATRNYIEANYCRNWQ